MSNSKQVPANQIYQSYRKNRSIVTHTKCDKSPYLSQKYNANIYLKRQDLQAIRSFKLRGACTAFRYLEQDQKKRGIVTASAGNHAQGIAYCCNIFKIKGTIFMPSITPKIKINSVRHYGGQWLDIVLNGTTFDDAVVEAKKFQENTNTTFIHAFDNLKVIEGQGGLAAQILQDWTAKDPIDYVFTCLGGGGLSSGIGCYLAQMAPDIKLLGFEPLGSPSMYNSLKKKQLVNLTTLETFADGASMKSTGSIPFGILSQLKNVNFDLELVDEGLIAKTMLQMYDNEAIIVEPAGALAVAGLQLRKQQIVGKNVICILSGSNNDISRLPQVRLRSMIYQKKEAYYIITSQNSINARWLIEKTVDPQCQDIIFINTAKKFNTAAGQILIGLSFLVAEAKRSFQQKVQAVGFKISGLKANDPLLKILL